jgi:hypothetical protein
LAGLEVSELRKLECKYATKAARGDADAERELDDIRGILKGKRMKKSLDEAALKASSDTLRKKYDRHEGDVISRMDYSGRTPGNPKTSEGGKTRINRRYRAMGLIKREMERRGERVGYQTPISAEMKARNAERERREREGAKREREERESNPNYQRNVAKYKAFLAKRDAKRKAARGG